MNDDAKIKDVPIALPDGSPVVVGMTIYTVKKLDVCSYSKSVETVKAWSGDTAAKIVENMVISVNQSSNARTFRLRSDRGCEQTYSVRNNCLPDLYGKRSAAVQKMKQLNEIDIQRIQAKLESLEKDYAQRKAKYTSTIKKIKAIKIN